MAIKAFFFSCNLYWTLPIVKYYYKRNIRSDCFGHTPVSPNTTSQNQFNNTRCCDWAKWHSPSWGGWSGSPPPLPYPPIAEKECLEFNMHGMRVETKGVLSVLKLGEGFWAIFILYLWSYHLCKLFHVVTSEVLWLLQEHLQFNPANSSHTIKTICLSWT